VFYDRHLVEIAREIQVCWPLRTLYADPSLSKA
jgi:hypothetical protein